MAYYLPLISERVSCDWALTSSNGAIEVSIYVLAEQTISRNSVAETERRVILDLGVELHSDSRAPDNIEDTRQSNNFEIASTETTRKLRQWRKNWLVGFEGRNEGTVYW